MRIVPVALAAVLVASVAVAQTPQPARVAEIGFGTGYDYETRTLIGEASSFPGGTEKVYCYTRIVGADAPAEITHAWYHEGETKAKVSLSVGSANWRTVSSKKLLASWTGQWEVKVLDSAGNVLGSATFSVE